MGPFMRFFGGSSRSDEPESGSETDAISSHAEGITISQEQADWGLYEDALEKSAKNLIAAAVRLKRLSDYYDPEPPVDGHAGAFEKLADAVGPPAVGINTNYSLVFGIGSRGYSYEDSYPAKALRTAEFELDMPESRGYENNLNETAELLEQTLRDLLELQYLAASFERGSGSYSETRYMACQSQLRSLRGANGYLAQVFGAYFNLSSLRLLATDPGGLTFVPDIAYDTRLLEGWQPIRVQEPVRSGAFAFLRPPRFEFDPNLVILRAGSGEHTPYERAAFEGRDGVFVPCCTDREQSYFDSLIREWAETLGEGRRNPGDYPEIQF